MPRILSVIDMGDGKAYVELDPDDFACGEVVSILTEEEADHLQWLSIQKERAACAALAARLGYEEVHDAINARSDE